MSVRELWLQWMLRQRSRPQRIQRFLRRQGMRPRKRPPQVGVFRAAAVQLVWRTCQSAAEYAALMHRRVREAVQQGAELVAFPENTGSLLVGIMPGLGEMLQNASLDEAMEQIGEDVKVADVYRLLGVATRRIYETTFRTLAQGFDVHIAAGSAVLPIADSRVQNIGYLFTPQGDVYRQAKCHLLPIEADWGLVPGEQIEVHETALGRLALPVCMDATYFETFRILRLLGAEVAIVPAADPQHPYSHWKALRGLWPRVQESQIYGVQAMLVGEAFGLRLTGRSAIYAPLALTPQHDGLLAQAETEDDDALVVADLDIAALRKYREENPLHYNKALYERYFPRIYSGFWRGGVR